MRHQLTNDEVMMIAGYAQTSTLCDSVMQGYIRPEAMKELAERMNNAWGGTQGVVDFCGIYIEFGEDMAKLFLEDFTDADRRGNEVYGFDNPEERVSWLTDREAHWKNY